MDVELLGQGFSMIMLRNVSLEPQETFREDVSFQVSDIVLISENKWNLFFHPFYLHFKTCVLK